jgi:hypothetical protein
MVEGNRAGQVILFPAKLRAFPLQPGDRVTVSLSEYGIVSKTYQVQDWQFAIDSAVMLVLKEDDASIYDLADAAGPDPQPNTTLPSPWVVSALASLAASSELRMQRDGTRVPVVTVSWAAIQDSHVANGGRVVVRWRRANDTAWEESSTTGDQIGLSFAGPAADDILVIEAFARSSLQQTGPAEFISHAVSSMPPDPSVARFTVPGDPTKIEIRGNTFRRIHGVTTGSDGIAAYSTAPIFGACSLAFTVPQNYGPLAVGLAQSAATVAGSMECAVHVPSASAAYYVTALGANIVGPIPLQQFDRLTDTASSCSRTGMWSTRPRPPSRRGGRAWLLAATGLAWTR